MTTNIWCHTKPLRNNSSFKIMSVEKLDKHFHWWNPANHLGTKNATLNLDNERERKLNRSWRTVHFRKQRKETSGVHLKIFTLHWQLENIERTLSLGDNISWNIFLGNIFIIPQEICIPSQSRYHLCEKVSDVHPENSWTDSYAF